MKCKRCGMETFRWMGRHICWGIADQDEERYFFTTAREWPEVRAMAYDND